MHFYNDQYDRFDKIHENRMEIITSSIHVLNKRVVYVLWAKFGIFVFIFYLAKTQDSSSPHSKIKIVTAL